MGTARDLIVVVGGRGVIGGAIVSRLREAGHRVITVGHDASMIGSEYRYADMLRAETLAPAVEGADVVVQSANFPTYPIEKPARHQTFLAFDGVGTERLVEAARAAGARRYVFISGVGTSPDSAKPYFQALWRGEHAVARAGLESVCIRPTLVYGPRDRGLNRILAAARRLPVVPVLGDGRQMHQPVFVNDVAELVSRAVGPRAPQGTFQIGGPDRMTLDSLLRTLFRSADVRAQLVHVPLLLARFGAAALERLPGSLLTTAAVDFLAEDFVADVAPVRSAFGLTLTPLDRGLQPYIRLGHA